LSFIRTHYDPSRGGHSHAPYQGSQELPHARLSGLPTGSFELGQPQALLQGSGPIRHDTNLRHDYRLCGDGLYMKARLLPWTVPPNLCHGDLAHVYGILVYVGDLKETKAAGDRRDEAITDSLRFAPLRRNIANATTQACVIARRLIRG
jgi:hypothetical protein